MKHDRRGGRKASTGSGGQLTRPIIAKALLRRLAKLAEAAGNEVELARAWSLVRAVETVVWNAEIDMVQEDLRPGWIADTLLRA